MRYVGKTIDSKTDRSKTKKTNIKLVIILINSIMYVMFKI